MGRAIGYRLDNRLAGQLVWLFASAPHEVSGLGAQSYGGGPAGTLPERLLLQERQVERRGRAIALDGRLLAAGRRMVDQHREGAVLWSRLRLAYGPARRCDADARDEWGLEQAPLVATCPAILRRAAADWPEWHLRRWGGRYGLLLADHRARRSDASLRRLLDAMPGVPPPVELAEVAAGVVESLCYRMSRARRMSQPFDEGDVALANEAHAQTDAMIAEASRAFAEAHAWVVKEDERVRKIRSGEHAREAERSRLDAERIRNEAALERAMLEPAEA